MTPNQPPRELDTDRDGPFSYPTESHAFTISMAVGIASILPVPRLKRFVFALIGLGEQGRSAAMKEAHRESWYALGGVTVGLFMGVALLGSMALLGYSLILH